LARNFLHIYAMRALTSFGAGVRLLSLTSRTTRRGGSGFPVLMPDAAASRAPYAACFTDDRMKSIMASNDAPG